MAWEKLIIIVCYYFRLDSSAKVIFWSLFGQVELEGFLIAEAGYETIWWTGLTLFGVFNIVAVLVAVNMLIAILNESYTRISVSKKPFSRSLLNRRSLGHHAMLLVLSSRFFGRTQRTAVYGLVLATMTIRKQSILFRTATSRAVEPRYNEPLYNEGYSTP